ncbi:hypothetical protein M3689_06310 [Alkalihalophilus marmarensis]|jgi:hypothetical protein|uniref:Uncharacterized protein n=1 Tax=Alkalihalophilus marmarensis DSM 21297 TaxID=1188261 RepID=U6SN05_9BACI|nr:hypothetical protein [Alkalihalophilus marmarensis]ERN53109.1 hypothetical protein A33I_13225 [Alkalihalophilus marmarensis DSM 21297]MCM3488920.1 hypothetical protein [Alkalihalophilus marmarensis]
MKHKSLFKWTLDALSSFGQVPLPILFSNQFMKKYTAYNEWNEWVAQSNQNIITIKDFEVEDESWTQFIQHSTAFSSGKEMIEAAEEFYFSQRPYGPFPII